MNQTIIRTTSGCVENLHKLFIMRCFLNVWYYISLLFIRFFPFDLILLCWTTVISWPSPVTKQRLRNISHAELWLEWIEFLSYKRNLFLYYRNKLTNTSLLSVINHTTWVTKYGKIECFLNLNILAKWTIHETWVWLKSKWHSESKMAIIFIERKAPLQCFICQH